MATLSISLLGTFQVRLDARPMLAFETDKCRALLAYLAVESSRPHRRESLAALLWPDRPEKNARHNLRQTLYGLRKAIGDPGRGIPLIIATYQDLQLDQQADWWLDVAEFQRLLAICKGHHRQQATLCPTCREALAAAVALYQGAFMAGFSQPDSPAFHQWQSEAEADYHRQVLDVLHRLAADRELANDFRQAAVWAQKKLELEPWSESACCQAMRALALSGQRQAALLQYERCQQVLREELNSQPTAQTQQLYAQIRDGALASIVPPQPHTASVSSPSSSTLTKPWRSPLFAGRSAQLAQLRTYLEQCLDGQGRIVLVQGEAGGGKTRLMAEFGGQALAAHKDLLVAASCCSPTLDGNAPPYGLFQKLINCLYQSYPGDPHWPAPLQEAVGQRLQSVQPLWGQIQAETWLQMASNQPSVIQSPMGVGDGSRLARGDSHLLREKGTQLLQTIARQHPLLLLLDDLHDLDVTSATMLLHLGQPVPGSRLLIIGSYRPEAIDWTGTTVPHSNLGTVQMRPPHPLPTVIHTLQRDRGQLVIDLNQANGRQFVDALIDGESNFLGEAFRQRLTAHTGGNPLFTVEMLRRFQALGELRKDGQGYWRAKPPLSWNQLPARVEAICAARFAWLPPSCQAIVMAASVQGQEFVAEAVSQVLSYSEAGLRHCLSNVLVKQHRLLEACSFQQSGGQAISRYRFRHLLFQRYATQQLDVVSHASIRAETDKALKELGLEPSREPIDA